MDDSTCIYKFGKVPKNNKFTYLIWRLTRLKVQIYLPTFCLFLYPSVNQHTKDSINPGHLLGSEHNRHQVKRLLKKENRKRWWVEFWGTMTLNDCVHGERCKRLKGTGNSESRVSSNSTLGQSPGHWKSLPFHLEYNT